MRILANSFCIYYLLRVRVEVVHLLKQTDNLYLLFLSYETPLHAGVPLDCPLASLDPPTYVCKHASELIIVLGAEASLVSRQVTHKS